MKEAVKEAVDSDKYNGYGPAHGMLRPQSTGGMLRLHMATRPEHILLLSAYFPFKQFFFFLLILLNILPITKKVFFLVYLQLLSMHDCCIRVIYSMVTALLEYLDLLAVFPEVHVAVCDYSSRVSPSLQCKIG